MFRLVALLAFISCVLASSIPDDWARIVNGEDTTIQDHPYQVSLQTKNGFHFCGGSIISKDIIVTAAHCMQTYGAYELQVRLASTVYDKGGKLVPVKSFRFHEGYNNATNVNDIAVVKLATSVRQSSNIRYIKLSEKTPSSGTNAIVTGWGTKCFSGCKSSRILQSVEVDIVSRELCDSKKFKYGSKIKETMLCAYGIKKDACQGDSGGPLVAGSRLVGVVSWGIGCALEGFPGVYCDVASVRRWIENTVKKL